METLPEEWIMQKWDFIFRMEQGWKEKTDTVIVKIQIPDKGKKACITREMNWVMFLHCLKRITKCVVDATNQLFNTLFANSRF